MSAISEPRVGDVFVNPRGTQYKVVARVDDVTVEVMDLKRQTTDRATWPMMVPENGWERIATVRADADRCGTVYPVWVALGWVQWQGAAGRERLMSIEYHRCQRTGVRGEIDGFIGYRCADHGGTSPC